MSEAVLGYTPTAKQLLFHAAKEREVLYGGAAGGGKTRAVAMDALIRCMGNAGCAAYLFRRTYPELEATLIKETLAALPRGVGAYSAQRHELALANGSRMCFRHCQKDADVTRYQGAEIQFLYIDELTHFPLSVYDYLKTRLRAPVRLNVTPLVRCTSNPGGPGHAWVRARFVDGGGAAARYIPALPSDNPHLSADYVRELSEKPDRLRDALLYGKWDAFEGQAFPEWDPAVHMVTPFAVPDTWTRYRSFDFGYARPFSVGWWAVDPDGGVWRTGEWYGWSGRANEGARLTPAAIAEGIRERERGLHVRGVADPSIWDSSRGESVAQQMAERGVRFEPGVHDRIAGKMALHRALAVDGNGAPGLRVFSTCAHFIRTIPALAYDPARAEDVDTSAEDHVYDETRYFLMMHHPRGRSAERPRAAGFDPLG